MKRNDIVITCLILIAMLAGGSAAYGEEDSPAITQTMKLYQGVISFPPPTWLNGQESVSDLKIVQNQQGNVFSFEQIPEDQNIEAWTKLYGVYAWYLPGYSLERFANESFNALALGCGNQPKIMVFGKNSDSVLMTYHCDDLKPEMVADGNNVESGFLYMGQVEQSFAKVYLAWRGKKENIGKSTWPLNKDSIEKAVSAMNKIRYFKPTN